MLLSTAYMPCIEYMAYIAQSESIAIEAHEHYKKQSYRNRTYIATANGLLELIIPVIQPNGSKTPIRDITISYAEMWQKKHWYAIESAYNSSPFFEFYQDMFYTFYTKKYTYLWDFNSDILITLLKICGIKTPITNSDIFTKIGELQTDKRYMLSPKHVHSIQIPEYTQVFIEKYGFLPTVSILDTICNLGPETKNYCLHIKI